MSICIIGGGLTGCVIALELAESGKKVVLFEKERELLSRASLANEGKIHLGFVYAADPTFQTAKRMIDDALVFRPILERWISSADFTGSIYDSFNYVVPNTSMLEVSAIRSHFKDVSEYLAARTKSGELSYLGQEDAHEFAETEIMRPGLQAEFHTGERGVWPGLIAQHISRSLCAHPAIEVRTGTQVIGVTSASGRWHVEIEGAGRDSGSFDVVVNCAWAGRRGLDAKAGFCDGAEWLYRYKFGVVLENASEVIAGNTPKNTTAMLGSYGDSVYHGAQDVLYCSWYPVGMCYSTTKLENEQRPDIGDPKAAIENTWQGYSSIDPAYQAVLQNADWRNARIIGDFIAAKARTDIDDPASLLHKRNDHGPRELAPGYWTVETAKYTSTARCADQCAREILGKR